MDDAAGRSIVHEVVFNNVCAVGWKRLLEAAARDCSAFYPQLAELLTVPELISAPETTIAAGEVIKAAYAQRLVSQSEAQAIELALSQVPQSTLIFRYEKPESIRNRLLMCIPEDQIISDELRGLARKLKEEGRCVITYLTTECPRSLDNFQPRTGCASKEPIQARQKIPVFLKRLSPSKSLSEGF